MYQQATDRLLGLAVTALLSAVALTSVAHAQSPVSIPDKSFPESVTSTSDGTLYVGSFNNGGVTKVAPGGKPEQLVKPGTNDPDADLAGAVAKKCHAQGLVVLTCGTFGNVLRFLPPLVIGDELLDEGLGIIEAAFAAV